MISSAQLNSSVTCAKWSPSRPGVFYIGRADGILEVWDLFDKSHCAMSTQSVATSAVSTINIRQYPGNLITCLFKIVGKSAQQFIAVGDDSGTLHILETPKNLQKIQKNEVLIMNGPFNYF